MNEWLASGTGVLLYYIYNCAVQAMQTPDSNSSAIYVFVFRLAHLIAGNINVTRKGFMKTMVQNVVQSELTPLTTAHTEACPTPKF